MSYFRIDLTLNPSPRERDFAANNEKFYTTLYCSYYLILEFIIKVINRIDFNPESALEFYY